MRPWEIGKGLEHHAVHMQLCFDLLAWIAEDVVSPTIRQKITSHVLESLRFLALDDSGTADFHLSEAEKLWGKASAQWHQPGDWVCWANPYASQSSGTLIEVLDGVALVKTEAGIEKKVFISSINLWMKKLQNAKGVFSEQQLAVVWANEKAIE